jgi:protein TonB
MFAGPLLDSRWPTRPRRGWSTLASFAVQAVAVASILVLPLIYTSRLPQLPLLERFVEVAPLAASPSAAHARTTNSPANHQRTVVRMVAPGNELNIPFAPDVSGMAVSGIWRFPEITTGFPETEFGTLDGEFDASAPPPQPLARQPRVSRIMEGNLIYRVQPEYPALAKLARIQGAVVLRAVIGKQGTIENLQAVGGPPLLIKAAVEAVRQWRYRPYRLNGEPVEVDTQITINFLLSGG